jgi:putative transposase
VPRAAPPPLLHELTIREHPGKAVFRFWQEGPGHDANVEGHDGVWNALRYVHNNPVKRGLCDKPEDWAWSSARQYKGLEPLRRHVPRVVRLASRGIMWGEP